MIKRKIENIVLSKLGKRKAIILTGARQVGKTTLLHRLFSQKDETLWLNGDEIEVQMLFENISAKRLQSIIGSKKTVIIDEAQRIADVGLRLKLITDQIPDVQLIATGSSSFDLLNKVNEPLTGRKWEYRMFPLSFGEMVDYHGFLDEKRMLPHRLLYGYYPNVVTGIGEGKELLKQLTESYLYKDLLMWEQVKKPDKLIKLLQALAYQVGSQVSYTELGQMCGLDYKTVEKYILLLEQCFVIFRLGSFSRNLRNELKNNRKIYFYDNGVRNALIADFRSIELRNDIGVLWENFLISERKKKLHYDNIWANVYFWRTQTQKEIDYVEDSDGVLSAYEFKWNPDAKVKQPTVFLDAYPNSVFKVIHRDNFDEFLL